MRIRIFVLLVLLSACTKQDPSWSLNQIKTGEKEFDSTRFCYTAPSSSTGIDLELLSTQEKLRIALIVHSQPIPSYRDEHEKALVRITALGKKQIIIASRREGGQRLLLPESIYPLLLDCLKKGEPLTFETPGYRETLICNHFPL